jgi:hypothetical protein
MNNDDVIAEFVLRKLAKKEKLREIVTQPGYKYYFGRNRIGLFASVISVAIITMSIAKDKAPAWGVIVAIISISAYLEVTRQRERFDALLELSDILKEENKANQAIHQRLGAGK